MAFAMLRIHDLNNINTDRQAAHVYLHLFLVAEILLLFQVALLVIDVHLHNACAYSRLGHAVSHGISGWRDGGIISGGVRG